MTPEERDWLTNLEPADTVEVAALLSWWLHVVTQEWRDG